MEKKETKWIDGVPYDVLSEEERERRKEEYKQEKRTKKKRKPGVIPTYHKGGKAGMDLENRFVSQWNKSMGKEKKKSYNVKKRLSFDDVEEEEEVVEENEFLSTFSTKTPDVEPRATFSKKASRQPNSGAMWHSKGDVTLAHALVEVKERGTKNGRGEKTISIPKEWLTKQADEAFQERRDFWYLAFAYKGDEEIYIIKPYDQEIELVKRLEELEEENLELKRNMSD